MNGAGSMLQPGAFCVQQAVSQAIGFPGMEDHPKICVNDDLIEFGITLNDSPWTSDKARAKGMKRFAIAELGTEGHKSGQMFEVAMVKVWNAKYGDTYGYVDGAYQIPGQAPNDLLPEVAEMAARVLIKLKSPGSKFLILTRKPRKKRKRNDKQDKVNRTEWREFKQNTHAGAPKQIA